MEDVNYKIIVNKILRYFKLIVESQSEHSRLDRVYIDYV